MQEPRTFEYFASDPLDVMFTVFEVADDSLHPKHRDLVRDLGDITGDELIQFREEGKYNHLISRKNVRSEERETKLWFMVDYLHRTIASKRLLILANKLGAEKPAPLDHPALKDIEMNNENLVPLREFTTNGTQLTRNGFSFTMSPIVSQSNSSYWLLTMLTNSNLKNRSWVRLDPFIVRGRKGVQKSFLQNVDWGKPLNWNSLKELQNPEHGQWMPSGLSSKDIKRTDFVWLPDHDKLHFTCEELPFATAIRERGSRYFHAVYDKKKGVLIHCDGAIRVYDGKEIEFRLNCHLKSPEVRKVGRRVKMFQIAGEVTEDEFSGMASAYYVWNEDVVKYFGD